MKGVVVWFTGLPSSGKSTLAATVRRALLERGVTPCVLDGDVVRARVLPELGYGESDRDRLYEALAQLASELAGQGLVVLVAATAHRREYRRRARALAPRFLEVWVTTPLAECRARDTKGLYGAGVDAMPGLSLDYEPPEQPELTASGGEDEAAVARVIEQVG